MLFTPMNWAHHLHLSPKARPNTPPNSTVHLPLFLPLFPICFLCSSHGLSFRSLLRPSPSVLFSFTLPPPHTYSFSASSLGGSHDGSGTASPRRWRQRAEPGAGEGRWRRAASGSTVQACDDGTIAVLDGERQGSERWRWRARAGRGGAAISGEPGMTASSGTASGVVAGFMTETSGTVPSVPIGQRNGAVQRRRTTEGGSPAVTHEAAVMHNQQREKGWV